MPNLSPVEYAIFRLKKRPYEWQAEALESVGLQLEGGPPTSLIAANGSGKTAEVIAPAVLWFLDRFPRGQVVITSGSGRQIKMQLWPAMQAHRHRLPGYEFMTDVVRTPQGGFAIGFSTDDPGKAEGWHPKISPSIDPVMIVVDEAKSVSPEIYEAFARCTKVVQIWASSPGEPAGKFYDSHHKRASKFHTIKATSADCPHIPQSKIDADREEFGAEHPLFLSMHMAEFGSSTDRLILSATHLNRAKRIQPAENREGLRVAFCDFAAGRDENVLALREGNTARIVAAWREKDTVQAARQFAEHFQRLKLRPSEIWGDADGLGIGFIDQLAELKWNINEFRGGSPSTQPERYKNLAAEVWHAGAVEINQGRVNIGEPDPQLYEQMTSRRSEWSEDGKLRNESKEKMAKRGLPSPDRADAYFGCIVCGPHMGGAVTKDKAESASFGGSAFASTTYTDF